MKTVSLFFGALLLTVLIGMPNTASAKSVNMTSSLSKGDLSYSPSNNRGGYRSENSRPRGPGVSTTNPAPKVIPKVISNTSSVKSTSWSSTPFNSLLTYYGTESGYSSSNVGWYPIFLKFGVTVNHNASAKKNGVFIKNGSTVSVGDTISFSAPLANTDIPWSGSANSTVLSVGNGHWVANAVSSGPCPFLNPFSSCGDLYSYNISSNSSGSWSSVTSYREMLSINPPIITYTGSAGVSCSPTPTGSSCNVTSPGSIAVTVKYSKTYGKFYYYNATYIPTFFDNIYVSSKGLTPLKACPVLYNSNNLWQCTGGLDYKLTVPAQQIQFTFTAKASTPSLTNPNPPTITGPTSATVGTAQTFTFNATDTNNPPKDIRYAIDWNADGITDQYAPAPTSVPVYVPSSASSSASYTPPLSIGNSYTFRVRTENSATATSTWVSHTVSLAQPISPPTVTFSTASSTIVSGGSATLGWSSSNATSCTGTGFSTGNTTSGSATVSPLATARYAIKCTNSGTSRTKNISIKVINPLASFSVSPSRVLSGNLVTIVWTTTDMQSCTVTNPSLLFSSTSGNKSETVTTQTTYTLSCIDKAGNAILPQSKTVNVVPVIQSF